MIRCGWCYGVACAHVTLEAALLSKNCVAFFTLERFFAGVRTHVHIEIALQHKCYATFCALENLISRMSVHVKIETGF